MLKQILKDAPTDPVTVGFAIVTVVLGALCLVALVARAVGGVVDQWSL